MWGSVGMQQCAGNHGTLCAGPHGKAQNGSGAGMVAGELLYCPLIFLSKEKSRRKGGASLGLTLSHSFHCFINIKVVYDPLLTTEKTASDR